MKTAALIIVLVASCQAFILPQQKNYWVKVPHHNVKDVDSGESIPSIEDVNDSRNPVPDLRITGGEIAKRGDYPWTTLIQIDGSYVCGGALISDEWILTGAECTYGFSMFQIYIGAQNWEDDEVDRLIVQTTNRIAHGDFDPSSFTNDIALIKLTHRIGFNDYIKPVTLPTHSMADQDFAETTAIAVGWGAISDDDPSLSKDLRFVSLTVINNTWCKDSWGTEITPGNICTDAQEKKSTCSGDNGGPLVTEDSKVLIGIQSFVANNGCQKGLSSVFTRVTHYLDWIEANSNVQITQ